ncbi:MAG: hypothetical protein ABSE62_09140 [Chthoniobacteraceae bacterium]
MKTLLFLALLAAVAGLAMDDRQQRAQLSEAQDQDAQLKSQVDAQANELNLLEAKVRQQSFYQAHAPRAASGPNGTPDPWGLQAPGSLNRGAYH